MRVFISFEHTLKHRAIWLQQYLTEAGHEAFIEDNFGAESPRSEIIKMVESTDVLVSIITPSYATSAATARELDRAEAANRYIIAIFAGLPSRDVRAKSYAAYRRIELTAEWNGSDAQWIEVAQSLVATLNITAKRSVPADLDIPDAVVVPPRAVLFHDIEDRLVAEQVLRSKRQWKRHEGHIQGAADAPHVLLWTKATAEPHSLVRQEFEQARGYADGRYLVAHDAEPPNDRELAVITLAEALASDESAPASPAATRESPKGLVVRLNREVLLENDNVPIDVFLDRCCCSPNVASLATSAYEIAISELAGGTVDRLRAVLNHTLVLRFQGEWRLAVDKINIELLATSADVTGSAAALRRLLELEGLSLQYELGDRRSPDAAAAIRQIQTQARKAGDLPGYVQAGRALGNVLREKGDFDAAEGVIQRTIGVAEYLTETSDGAYGDLVLADCHRELAQLYTARLDFAKASISIRDAQELLDASESVATRPAAYLRAVLAYVDAILAERDSNRAYSASPTERAHKALMTLSRFDNPIRLATVYDWLGRAWTRHVPHRHEDLLRSKEYLGKALRMRRTHGHKYTEGISYLSLGGLYEALDEPVPAIANYREARQIFNERGLLPALARSHAAMARVYLRMSQAPGDENSELYKQQVEAAERLYRALHLENEGLELRFALEHSGRQSFEEVPDETPLIAVGEYHLHKWIRERASADAPGLDQNFKLILGIGDDAAVMGMESSTDVGLVYTTDAAPGSLARIDANPEYVGRFTVVQTLSDVLAMGAKPVGVLVNLFLSRKVTVGYVRRLIQAITREAARYGAPVIGGDVKERGEQSVGCVGVGYADRTKVLTRSAARPGQVVGITLASEPSGKGSRLIGTRWVQELVEYYHMDRDADLAAFPELADAVKADAKYDLLYLPDKVMASAVRTGLMRAAMDTSDGVLACLEIIGRESQVGFELDETAISLIIDRPAEALANVLNVPPALFLFSAGHDWEIVFTCEEGDFEVLSAAVDADLRGNGRVVRIGVVTDRSDADASSVRLIRADGRKDVLRFYTDEKFVPRRYQDRPSQWLGFASRFSPSPNDTILPDVEGLG